MLNFKYKFIIFLVGSIFLFLTSLLLNKYGIIIGWTIGLIISLLFQFLSLKLKKIENVNRINKFIIFFIFFRFFLIIITLIFCSLMQFYFKIEFFNWSVFFCSLALIINNLIIIFDSKFNE